jgi:hypothetical protein
MRTIVIKPGLGVDLATRSGPGLHELTRVNSEKLKKKYLSFNILYEKIKKQSVWIYVNYTCCKQLGLKYYFKMFFYPTLERYYLILLS